MKKYNLLTSNKPCDTRAKIPNWLTNEVVQLNYKYNKMTYMVLPSNKREYRVERMWNYFVL